MDECIFCKIINGQIPAKKVYEDDYVLAILDIAPANKGHIVIIPKSHSKNIFSLDDDYVKRCFLLSKRIANSLMKVLNCDGVNILQNNEIAAGQTVFHFHIHVIPRFNNDSCIIHWVPAEYHEDEMDFLSEKISSSL